jgi:hypothetical protein
MPAEGCLVRVVAVCACKVWADYLGQHSALHDAWLTQIVRGLCVMLHRDSSRLVSDQTVCMLICVLLPNWLVYI